MTFIFLTLLFMGCLLTYLTKKNADARNERKMNKRYGKETSKKDTKGM